MLARALIVLLVVLNLGVAVWWAARGAPAREPPSAAAPGVPTLRLLRDLPRGAVPPVRSEPVATADPATASAPTATPATSAQEPATASPAAAVAERCYAFGPFAPGAALDAARARLKPQALRMRERTGAAAAASGSWRVMLPVQGDRAAAQAVATRIAAAGFNDYYVVADGGDASAIALGLYGSEAAARQRESALRAAGFADVRAEAIGSAAPPVWLDAAIAETASSKTLGRALGATRVQTVDCATVR